MRGFVTIATGNDAYYQLAANLLHSYRLYAADDTPFAIICDRETEQTKAFDDVILMEEANCSYMDKLLLYHYTPYDETIFIDADSLILSDPSGVWDDFADADDVSCYGCRYPLDSDRAWFSYDGIGVYKDKVSFLIDLHGGIYYLRKTERCRSIFEKAIELAGEYQKYSFKNFQNPADEPVLALSMAIHHSIPCEKPARVIFLPSYWDCIAVTPAGEVRLKKQTCTREILHLATANTRRFVYRYLVEVNQRQQGSVLAYLRMWALTLPTEIKMGFRHKAGQLARHILPASLVTEIKIFLHK